MSSKIKPNISIKRHRKTKKRMFLWLLSLVLVTTSLVLVNFSAKAAEQIYFNYGLLKVSVSLTALETYAETGKIEDELKLYFLFINAENQQKLRDVLRFNLNINPMQLAQGLYCPMGEKLLQYLGEMIQIKDGSNGAIALREALIKTAESQSFTPINVLQNFPGEVQFNLIKILAVNREFSALLEGTEKLLTEVKQITLTAAATEEKVDFSTLPDLRQPGNISFYQETLTLNDKSRNRQFIVNLYLPDNHRTIEEGRPKLEDRSWKEEKGRKTEVGRPKLEDRSWNKLMGTQTPSNCQHHVDCGVLNPKEKDKTIPLIILSPGLAAKLSQWQHLAIHLASHGFAVAKIQHPGSDFNHFQAFLEGKETEIFQLREFINRPLDITYLLDELERRNKLQYQGKLNLKNVGMAGQSFGAYTTLALAGAKINFTQLKQDCLPQIKSLNPSLFLQCRALDLPQKNYDLRDKRIKSILIMDPVNSSIFGKSGLSHINIPILWVAGSEDQLTPVVIEQVYPFTWLPVTEKYFMLTKGAKHLDFNITEIQNVESVDDDSLNQLVSASSPVIKSYIDAFGLAFFRAYLENNSDYLDYLRSSYAVAISEEPYTLGFLSTLTAEKLVPALTKD